MRRTFSWLAFLLTTLGVAVPVSATCPTEAPGAIAIATSPVVYSYEAQPNGPVTFVVKPLPSGFFPPATYDPGYSIQPCDLVAWNFGDGVSLTLTGADRVTHDYPNPGNYTITVTVTNALGSATVRTALVVATSPTRLSYVTSSINVRFPNSATGSCPKCIEAREGRTTTVSVKRTLDLSRTVSVDAVVRIDNIDVRAPLTFAPGETQKSFEITIPDDHIYSGIRFPYLEFANATGGTLTDENVADKPHVVVIDATSAPLLSIDPTFTVLEGHSGLKVISIPVHLSAPMGVDTYAYSFPTAGSATSSDFVLQSGPYFHSGETVSEVRVSIRGNTKPEPDKTFQIQLSAVRTNEDAEFGNSVCVVTIANDDAALTPAATSANSLQPLTLTLDIGSPLTAAATVSFTSSDPNVIPNPQSIVMTPGTTRKDMTLTPRASGQSQITALVPGRTTQPSIVNVDLAAIPALPYRSLIALAFALAVVALARMSS